MFRTNWYYDEPCEYGRRRCVYSREQALREHRDYWVVEMRSVDPETLERLDEVGIDERAFEDWLAMYLAAPTDMPPGVYVSRVVK